MPTRYTIRWYLASGLARLICALTMRVRVEGADHLPKRGAAILASNHVSFLDPAVLSMVVFGRRRTARFLTAAEFFANRWFGWGLKYMQQIPIRRGENDRAAILEAEGSLRQGVIVGLFPEGKVNDHPEALLPGKRGVARLALETGTPILPIAVWGPQRKMPRGGIKWRPLRVRVAMVVGAPIDPHGTHEATEDALRGLTDEVMRRIEELRVRAVDLVDGSGTTASPQPR